MGKHNSIEEAKELWQQEPDDSVVFRAATEDIDEYPPEVQAIIREESERRKSLNAERERKQKESACAIKATRTKIAESIGVSLSILIPCGILSLLFGNTVWGIGGIMLVAALIKIWKPKKH